MGIFGWSDAAFDAWKTQTPEEFFGIREQPEQEDAEPPCGRVALGEYGPEEQAYDLAF